MIKFKDFLFCQLKQNVKILILIKIHLSGSKIVKMSMLILLM
jgi:hypothetical protein